MRRNATWIILALTLPLCELHTFWHGDGRTSNWIIDRPTPMLIEWNVKYAVSQITVILYFLAWLLYVPTRSNKVIVRAFFAVALLDTMLYFWNYKTDGYGYVYFAYFFFFLLFVRKKP